MINNIRNFAIIAHIDHGKSTLADRLIEYCGGVESRNIKEQMLDSMDIERERGITIKAQTVRLSYKGYQLNIVDTPGHVDFSYEVSRSLAACEGSLLIVDASQGVEAQTLANAYLAIDSNHEIIPVLNKIDLPSSDVSNVKGQIENIIGIDAQDAVLISAKTGEGINKVLDAIISKLPAPKGIESDNLQALIIDSWYDPFLGIITLLRIKNGVIKKGIKITMMATGQNYTVDNVGIFTPDKKFTNELKAGEIGFMLTGMKNITDCKIGDTIISQGDLKTKSLEGFKENLPMVFCSMFPEDSSMFENLKKGLYRLGLNDSGLSFEMESSTALGFGFRCGFLGLLHLEIVEERLSREFDLDLVTTAPSVIYEVFKTDGSKIMVHNPHDLPEPNYIKIMKEPWIIASIFVPDDNLGAIIDLCIKRRGIQKNISYTGGRVLVEFYIPLNEVIFDFYDKLKSISHGYASFDYALDGYKDGDLVCLSVLINGETVDALSFIVHKEFAEKRGRAICEKLKDLIPRQLFKVAIQAAIGAKVIARETIQALRKDVTAKCYGGDISRKRKLLEKQKAGKKRMQQIGNINIPKSVYLKALTIKDD